MGFVDLQSKEEQAATLARKKSNLIKHVRLEYPEQRRREEI